MKAPNRNVVITMEWLYGGTMRTLAEHHGLSAERIHQIVTATLKRYGMPAVPPGKHGRRDTALAFTMAVRREHSEVFADTPEHFYHHEQAYRSNHIELARAHNWSSK